MCGLWGTRRSYLIALFGRNASKMKEATPRKNGPCEAVVRGKEADLAPASLNLLITKQALKAGRSMWEASTPLPIVKNIYMSGNSAFGSSAFGSCA